LDRGSCRSWLAPDAPCGAAFWFQIGLSLAK
jgi:hypothetical protein